MRWPHAMPRAPFDGPPGGLERLRQGATHRRLPQFLGAGMSLEKPPSVVLVGLEPGHRRDLRSVEVGDGLGGERYPHLVGDRLVYTVDELLTTVTGGAERGL